MKKIKLNLEQLKVTSFRTSAAAREAGTVLGEQQCTCPTNCTCPGCPTCDASCNGTCGGSCNGTCGDTCYGTCAGQYTCDYTCDSCYFTQCANTCYNCPTVSGGRCECWL